MKVSVTAQVLSNNVAAEMKRMAFDSNSPEGMPKEAEYSRICYLWISCLIVLMVCQ